MAEQSGSADERWIIEPGPEAPHAQKLGASEVARAQKLAKAKKYADAAAVLEQVARTWPAALHDCNLALAYLRAGAYTRAQLVWELSALRNTPRPKWCTGEVSTQLSNALRASGFVPTTIDVVPPDAVIEVLGVAMRGMRTVWLPPGQATIMASAPGRDAKTVTASISAPTTRVTITLEEPPPPEPVQPDAGVAEPMAPVDAAAIAPPVAPADAAPAVQHLPPPPPSSLITINGTPVGRRYIALSVAIGGWAAAGVLGYLAYDAKQDADRLYPTDPAFDDARSSWSTYRYSALGAAAVGAVGTALFIYFLTDKDKPIPALAVSVGEDSVGIGYSGTFGGGR